MNEAHVQQLGEVDGVTMWWCTQCHAQAPGVGKDGKEKPEITHKVDCNPPASPPPPPPPG